MDEKKKKQKIENLGKNQHRNNNHDEQRLIAVNWVLKTNYKKQKQIQQKLTNNKNMKT